MTLNLCQRSFNVIDLGGKRRILAYRGSDNRRKHGKGRGIRGVGSARNVLSRN